MCSLDSVGRVLLLETKVELEKVITRRYTYTLNTTDANRITTSRFILGVTPKLD